MQQYGASVQGVTLRASALQATGAVATGANASYVMSAFTQVSFTPQYENGDEFTLKQADGSVCISYLGDDVLKRVTMQLAICEPDPELTAILTGGTILTAPIGTTTTAASAAISAATLSLVASVAAGTYTVDTAGNAETVTITAVTGTTSPFTAVLAAPTTKVHTSGVAVSGAQQSVGYAAPFVGVDANPNGTALEVWSYRVVNGRRAGAYPYFRWVFPYTQLYLTGERVIENGVLATTFTGYGVGNASFSTGPAKDWAFISDRAYQYALDSAAPIGLRGYQTVT